MDRIDIGSVRELFISCFKYKVQFVQGDYGEWDKVLGNASYVPVEYVPTSLRYQNGYIRCFYEEVHDLSVVISGQEGALCAWPLTLVYNDDRCWICTNEKEVLPPLFISGVTHKVKNHIISDCMNALNAVQRLIIEQLHLDKSHSEKLLNWKTRCNQLREMGGNGIDIWYRRCKEKGAETDVTTDLYVDLALGLEEIHTNIRKHYKALINKAEKLWNCEIISKVSDEEIECFRRMHIEVSGRETRSKDTWVLQQEAVNRGNGFIVKLTDPEGNFVGESLFEHSRDEGLYSVGVYKRELFDEPVSHVVQWKAIEHMRAIGLRKYKIGERCYPGKTMNLRQPTEKEMSISYFKEGFATDYVHTFIVTNRTEDGI